MIFALINIIKSPSPKDYFLFEIENMHLKGGEHS